MREISEKKLGILLVSPAVILILAINVYPVLMSGYMSLFDIRGLINRGFVGLGNYLSLLRTPRLWGSLTATAYFTFGTVTVQILLGLVVALALNVEFRFRSLVRSIIVVPWAIPSSLAALMWGRFLSPIDGHFNSLLRSLSLASGEINWFLHPALALTMVIWVDTWKMTPLYILIFLAGLQAIPKELYDSAKVDGANKIQSLIHITLPNLKPLIIIVIILRTMLVFHAFDVIYILTAGGPGDSTRVLSYYAFQETFQLMNQGRGAALGFILFAITAVITWVYYKGFQLE